MIKRIRSHRVKEGVWDEVEGDSRGLSEIGTEEGGVEVACGGSYATNLGKDHQLMLYHPDKYIHMIQLDCYTSGNLWYKNLPHHIRLYL